MSEIISSVEALIREAAETYVMPIFNDPEKFAVEKSPGEWVTNADKDSESFLTSALSSLIPRSLVVGEEAVNTDTNVLARLADSGALWIIDPLDGTTNFARGESPFAIMVALYQGGEARACWIFDPVSLQFCIAESGSGSWINGRRINTKKVDLELSHVRGAVLHRFLPPGLSTHMNEVESKFAALTRGSQCAGNDYPMLVKGEINFALYWRTLPWDHAPGILFLQEAGGHAARLDGSAYRVQDAERPGLLVACDKSIWDLVRSEIGLVTRE